MIRLMGKGAKVRIWLKPLASPQVHADATLTLLGTVFAYIYSIWLVVFWMTPRQVFREYTLDNLGFELLDETRGLNWQSGDLDRLKANIKTGIAVSLLVRAGWGPAAILKQVKEVRES